MFPMGFFGSTDTADGKARRVLSDLSEDASPFDILQAVDQKAGDTVDPDDVVQTLRDLDETVDAKLSAVEGTGVDQKELRAAAGTLADRSALSEADAVQFLSAVATGDVDQAALADLTDTAPDTESDADAGADADTTAGTDAGADANTQTDMNTDPGTPDGSGTDADSAPDGGVDQKQDGNGDGDGDGGDTAGPLDMLNDDARETVEEFAALAGKDPEECVQEVMGMGGGNDADTTAPAADDAPPADPAPDMNAGKMDDEYDQKLNERVAEAMTSDEVLDEFAGVVAQKMIDSDEFADSLVETVDKKGEFVTTSDTVVTAPSTGSKTVGESRSLTGGGDE